MFQPHVQQASLYGVPPVAFPTFLDCFLLLTIFGCVHVCLQDEYSKLSTKDGKTFILCEKIGMFPNIEQVSFIQAIVIIDQTYELTGI